jgi:hypothetical protein
LAGEEGFEHRVNRNDFKPSVHSRHLKDTHIISIKML